MRQLILILIVVVAFIFLRKRSAPRARGEDREGVPERMVECARCGVNLPISESLQARGRHYCCEEHRAHDA
jgi:uncharacterized protein